MKSLLVILCILSLGLFASCGDDATDDGGDGGEDNNSAE